MMDPLEGLLWWSFTTGFVVVMEMGAEVVGLG